MSLWCYHVSLIQQLYKNNLFGREGVIGNARLECHDRTHGADQLLPSQRSLLLNFSESSLSSISRILIGIVNLDCIGGINAKDDKPKQFQTKSYIVKPMFLSVKGLFIGDDVFICASR